MLWFRPETIPHRAPRPVARQADCHRPARPPAHSAGKLRAVSGVGPGAIATVEDGGAGGRRPAATPGDGVGRQPGRATRHPELWPRRMNEDLDAFAYVASHDLKEPLRGIYKYAHQLLEEQAVSGRGKAARNWMKKIDAPDATNGRSARLAAPVLTGRPGKRTRVRGSRSRTRYWPRRSRWSAREPSLADPELIHPAFCLPLIATGYAAARSWSISSRTPLKYNDKLEKQVEIGYIGPGEERSPPRVPGERGRPRQSYYVRDNGIGIQPKHFTQMFKIFKRLHGRERVRRRHRCRADHRQEAGRAARRTDLGGVHPRRGLDLLLYPRPREASMITYRPIVLVCEDCDEDFDTLKDAARTAGVAADLRRATTGDACLTLLRGNGGEPATPRWCSWTSIPPGLTAGRPSRRSRRTRRSDTCRWSCSPPPQTRGTWRSAITPGANAYHVKPIRYADHIQVLLDVFTYWLGTVALPDQERGRP